MERRSMGWTAGAAWTLASWILLAGPVEAQCCHDGCDATERDASGCCPPDRCRRAPALEDALRHHSEAQRLSRHTFELDPRLAALAHREYERAVVDYREFLRTHPDDPSVYEVRYNYADALFWSDQYEEAARAYAEVRDSRLDDQFLPESARRVVESLHRLIQQAERGGVLHVRSDPATDAPQPSGDPPRVTPIEMPPLVQRLFDAREIYLARVPEARDADRVRGQYYYENALLLFYYGRWHEARSRLLRVYDERCSGPEADSTGEVAWERLRQMAIALHDTRELERLSRDASSRACTFGRAM